MRRLIIRPGAIGDFVVSLPAMECLRCDYLEIWAAGQNVPLARFAHKARSIASTGLDRLGIVEPDAALVDTLRGFDQIVSWYGANRPEFRELVAAMGLPFKFFRALPPEGYQRTAAEFYLGQVLALTECSSDGIPRIGCPSVRADFGVIHPFAGSRKKCWPLENFKELARRLAERMPVKWCAGPEEDLGGAERFTDLYELACWLASARVFIGNDSGPAHLAAAAGTPVVALFGASDHHVWAPRGSQVAIAAAPSLAEIKVEQVESLVYYTLGGIR